MKRTIFVLLFAFQSMAETIYVSDQGSGTGSGADVSNYMSIAGFNTAGNWDIDVANDGKIGPGDTVQFAGTITNQAIIQGSGTSAAWITLSLGSSQFAHPAWGANGAITDGTTIEYIIINGPMTGAATNPASWLAPSFINTANTNGSPVYDGSSRFINLDPANHIRLQNFLFTNLYVRAPGSSNDLGESGSAIRLRGPVGDLIVSNVAGFQGATATSLNGSGGTPSSPATNLWTRNSYFFGFSTAVQVGMANGTVVSFCGMQNCILDGFDIWAGIPTPNQHHCDGFQSITAGGSDPATTYFTNMIVSGNIIGPRMGPILSGGVVDSMNSPIFIQEHATDVKCYNNLIIAGAGYGWGNPGIRVTTADLIYTNFHGKKSLIANNIIISEETGTGLGPLNADCFNNIVYKTSSYISQNSSTLWALGGYWPVSNTNLFYLAKERSSSSAFGVNSGPWAASYTRLRWTNSPATGPADKNLALDMDSIFEENPLFDSSYRPQAGSPALARGMNLTDYGITNDILGNPRPSSGAWTIGAFEGTNASVIFTRSIRTGIQTSTGKVVWR